MFHVLPIPTNVYSLPLTISLTRMVHLKKNFTKDELALAPHNHTKSMVYVRVHSRCPECNGFRCPMISIHHYSIRVFSSTRQENSVVKRSKYSASLDLGPGSVTY